MGVVPDLARRLPGRGVWVDATPEAVAEAVRRKAFAKSLKPKCRSRRPAEPVERLSAEARWPRPVSLANKAGLVVAGFAKVEELIEAGQAVALIHAADAAADGVGKLDRKFKALCGLDATSAAIVRELAGRN